MSSDLETVRLSLEKDRFAATSGIALVELRPGYGKAQMKIEARHLNGFDIVHGGVIFTLADFAFAAAANSAGRVAVSVNGNISFLKPARTGMLWAEATEISRSRRISTCTVRVTDDAGELIALFQGTAYIKDEEIRD